MLCNQLPTDKRGLIYLPRISQMEICSEILRHRGIRAVELWSTNNEDNWMGDHQLKVRKYIIENEKLPENVDVLLINKSYETSINIKTKVDYVVVHSSDDTVVTQARGRIRSDIDSLYRYDSSVMDVFEPPECLLNRKLFKEDIRQFVDEHQIMNDNGRPASVQEMVGAIVRSGYEVRHGKIKGGKRYNILYKS